jgi:vacuolar-type H+-ATPase subunit I/STV1
MPVGHCHIFINTKIRKFQAVIEEIRQDIQSKRKSSAIDGIKKTKSTIKSKSSEFIQMCRSPKTCDGILSEMTSVLDPLSQNVAESQTFLNGSDQERAALDKAYDLQDRLQKLLTQLEEQMVPEGYATPVPEEYSDLPQLKGGRATVEFVLRKPDNAPFDVEGVNYPEAKMVMVIGEFVALVVVAVVVVDDDDDDDDDVCSY